MSKKVLITGGTGLVGSALSRHFYKLGWQVSHLSRTTSPEDNFSTFVWDVEKGEVDLEAFKGINILIHLAGAGVADEPWTAKRKELIEKSRTEGTKLLVNKLKESGERPEVIVCASASGYYGSDTSEEWVDETSPSGDDFLAVVTKKWEDAQEGFKEVTDRLVQLRIGVVLTKKGGALPKLVQPVKYYVGAPLGSGKQFVPWIHIKDLLRMFHLATEEKSMRGVYNAVAPSPVTNEELTKHIGKVLHIPTLPVHVPSFVLKNLLGEMAIIVLNGKRIAPKKIQESGFTFRFENVDDALKDLLG